jgi:hypothetical protein
MEPLRAEPVDRLLVQVSSYILITVLAFFDVVQWRLSEHEVVVGWQSGATKLVLVLV